MGKTATLLRTVFFGLLLAGLIVIQYCWIKTLQKDKLEKFKYGIISGIDNAARNMPFTGSLQTLTDTAISSALHRSFSAKGLSTVPFEFNLGLGSIHLTSRGFNQKLTSSVNNLTLSYLLHQEDQKPPSNDLLTVVIPFANSLVWKEMTGIIAISVLLTLMILTVFYFATKYGRPGQQLFYSQRDNAMKNMMQQLEGPLSTVSVAAEALQNARVMGDVAKIKFYRQVINEENKRINEEVKRLLRELTAFK